jgi:hypothetical protein
MCLTVPNSPITYNLSNFITSYRSLGDKIIEVLLYMGEGGGFPQVRTVVSQVSPRSLVACPNTKKVQNEF